MSPTPQASHPRCLQEPQDGPEVHALNRLLAKVVETEAGFLLIHGRLAAISNQRLVYPNHDDDVFRKFILNS